jgi:hypothetical protein
LSVGVDRQEAESQYTQTGKQHFSEIFHISQDLLMNKNYQIYLGTLTLFKSLQILMASNHIVRPVLELTVLHPKTLAFRDDGQI